MRNQAMFLGTLLIKYQVGPKLANLNGNCRLRFFIPWTHKRKGDILSFLATKKRYSGRMKMKFLVSILFTLQHMIIHKIFV